MYPPPGNTGYPPVPIVFISHSHQSRYSEKLQHPEIVEWTWEALKLAGAVPWLDYKSITPGQDWVDAIQRGVNSCIIMLAVMPPDYSQPMHWEISRALTQRKTVIPICTRDLSVLQRYNLNQVQALIYERPPNAYKDKNALSITQEKIDYVTQVRNCIRSYLVRQL